MKFVVYVQVYLYTPRSMANKSLEVQKMPRGSAIATVRPFFFKDSIQQHILKLLDFVLNKYQLICKLFPHQKV